MSAKHRGVRGGRRRGNRRLARFVTASTAVVITAVAIGGRLLLSGGAEQSLVEVEARMGRTDEIELNRATTPSPAETTRPQESRAAAPPEPAQVLWPKRLAKLLVESEGAVEVAAVREALASHFKPA